MHVRVLLVITVIGHALGFVESVRKTDSDLFAPHCVFSPAPSGLRHPNVVTVTGVLVYTDRVEIVMERCTPFRLPPALGMAMPLSPRRSVSG